jgi:hypothetical protein
LKQRILKSSKGHESKDEEARQGDQQVEKHEFGPNR